MTSITRTRTRSRCSWSCDAATAPEGRRRGAGYAVATGEPLLASNVTDQSEIEIREEERETYARLGPKSYMIVPLLARGRVIGALTMLSTHRGPPLRASADLEFAQHLGRRFALAIDNARLYDEAERSRAMLDTLFRSVPIGLGFLDTRPALRAGQRRASPGCRDGPTGRARRAVARRVLVDPGGRAVGASACSTRASLCSTDVVEHSDGLRHLPGVDLAGARRATARSPGLGRDA